MDPSASHSATASAITTDPLDDLDALLNLEETYFAEGLARGREDGAETGRREGRAFGLAHGFERFAAMGRLHGRAVVWESRIRAAVAHEGRPTQELPAKSSTQEDMNTEGESSEEHGHEPFLPNLYATSVRAEGRNEQSDVPTAQDEEMIAIGSAEGVEEDLRQLLQEHRWQPIRQNPRLRKHMTLLYGLTEPESLGCENQEEAVAEFDDRFKRAVAKVGIISKIVGEEVEVETETRGVKGEGDMKRGSEARRGREVGIEDVDILKVRH